MTLFSLTHYCPNYNLQRMNLDLLPALALFAVSSSITPGPNNVMVTASGANFGFARTLPHMLGISIGFPVMVIAVGLGLGQVFAQLPMLHSVMKWVGAAYLLWLAWKLATARPTGIDDGAPAQSRPMTLLQAAAFQWVNPKAWIMAVGAMSTFTTVGGDPIVEASIIGGMFALACLPSVALWAGFGVALRRWLSSATALRRFNLSMAALLVISLVPTLA